MRTPRRVAHGIDAGVAGRPQVRPDGDAPVGMGDAGGGQVQAVKVHLPAGGDQQMGAGHGAPRRS